MSPGVAYLLLKELRRREHGLEHFSEVDLLMVRSPGYVSCAQAIASRAWPFLISNVFRPCTSPYTLSLLKDLSAGVSKWVSYEVREDEGTQSPSETLERRSGSCRDFALLFAEAARCLGFGARLVSGYLQPAQNVLGSQGGGSTHAWAEIYIPGVGWITFDPTNGTTGSFGMIPIAVVRDIRLAMPVAGGFVGPSNALSDMAVEVAVG